MKSCGIGMKFITDIEAVKAQSKWWENTNGLWGYEILAKETGQPEKVCFKCLERAIDRGYLDYGVSVRTAWLTEKGRALIASGGMNK